MAIQRSDPNTVFLGGEHTQIGDLAASEPIVPGMLVERWNNAGVIRFRRHATAGGPAAHLVALNHSMVNATVDTPYLTNDLMEVSAGRGGATYWMLLASGQTVVAGDKLESAGDGTLRKGATVPLFSSLENKTTTGFGRCRVEVI